MVYKYVFLTLYEVSLKNYILVQLLACCYLGGWVGVGGSLGSLTR